MIDTTLRNALYENQRAIIKTVAQKRRGIGVRISKKNIVEDEWLHSVPKKKRSNMIIIRTLVFLLLMLISA